MDIKVEDVNSKDIRDILASASINTFSTPATNPWTASDIDKLELGTDNYQKLVEACRFFYKKDPIVSSTLNKLVEIGINEIVFNKNGLSDNEFRIFLAIKDKLEEFAEVMALEYLISGLVVPEVAYKRVNKEELKSFGIKKYTSGLILPVTMYIRNPTSIKIKATPFADKPSYFLVVPPEIVYFIKNQGKYVDGTEDRVAYEKMLELYPDFVERVRKGQLEFLIEENSELIFRRKPQPGDPYPVPYLLPALESLKHKRNLRRMDYAIAARVIGAIQLFKLGSDDFPVLEENKDEQFGAIKEQMLWRNSDGKDVERIFQLFANHTLAVEWIVPDTEALLNEQKYVSINQDIIYSLGFPRILITGESEKTGTSDPQYAMMSPSRTMENFRKKIIEVIRKIVNKIADDNSLKNAPIVNFKPLTLFDHQTLLKSLADLYATGNISRHTYASELGYDWDDEIDEKEAENKVMKEKGIEEFAPRPFSNSPDDNQQQPAKSKPSDVKNNSNNKNGDN